MAGRLSGIVGDGRSYRDPEVWEFPERGCPTLNLGIPSLSFHIRCPDFLTLVDGLLGYGQVLWAVSLHTLRVQAIV